MKADKAIDPVARRYRVSGRVQGVGFRWFVREQARALDLAGTVRNLPDGAVQVDVVGSAVGVAALEGALAVGPAGATVDALEIVLRDCDAVTAIGAPAHPFAIARGA